MQTKTDKIYIGNLDELSKKARATALIAGENLRLYRMHCELSYRKVESETNISYSQICSYEKHGVRNFNDYVILIGFYRHYCKWKCLDEPEGIRQISSLL